MKKTTADTGGHLHMTVAMTKIEAGVLGSTNSQNDSPHSLMPASTYKIADIFKNVTPEDKHFLKYVPDSFLSIEQLKEKKAVLESDKARISQFKFSDIKRWTSSASNTASNDLLRSTQMSHKNTVPQAK